MASLADLVGGFQQGADWRASMEETQERKKDRQAAREGRRIWMEQEVGSDRMAEFDQYFDPYEMRLKGLWGNAKDFFTGGMRRQAIPGGAEVPTAGPTTAPGAGVPPDPGAGTTRARGANQVPRQALADGGRAGRGRNRSRAIDPSNDYSTTEGRQPWNPVGEMARSVGNVLSPNRGNAPAAFPGVRRALDAAGEEFQGMGEEYERFGGGARGAGAAARKMAGGVGIGALITPVNAMGDIAAPVTDFVGGALGLHEDSQRTPAASAPPEQDPAVESAVLASPPTGDGGAATPQQGPTPTEQRAQADESAQLVEDAALGTADIDPADMPRFSTRDWEDYRSEYVAGALLQGIDPLTAHNQVTQMQQQGFLRYGQQAAAMLDAGNPMGAARALTAAYQYFPNGTDTRFGIQTDPDTGQPVLVGYAIDEETGEPTGRAQAITAQYLASSMMNFQDPEAFSTWTQDQHKFAQELRDYYEREMPLAQSQIDSRYGNLEIGRYNAETGRMRAINDAASGSGAGGMRQADYDRANAVFNEELELMSFDDPQAARQLASAMSRYYVTEKQYDPGLDYNTVYSRVMGAYEDGELEQLMEQLGGP